MRVHQLLVQEHRPYCMFSTLCVRVSQRLRSSRCRVHQHGAWFQDSLPASQGASRGVEFIRGSFGNIKSEWRPQVQIDLHILRACSPVRSSAAMSARSQLMWINDVGDPRAKRDASTQSLIKKHVMKSIGESRRKPHKSDRSIRKHVLSSGPEPGRYTFKEITGDPVYFSPSDEDGDRAVDAIYYPLHSDTTRSSLFSRSTATCHLLAAFPH